MSDSLALLPLALPLLAVLLTPLLSCLKLTRFAHLPAIVAFGASAVIALTLLVRLDEMPSHHPSFSTTAVTWFSAGLVNIDFSITLDPLSLIMLSTVMFIATWIALFSAGYMRGDHGEPDGGYVRYFTVMSLFVFSMALLVLANNFLLLVAGWEGVGLCSYLLVGYYYAKPAAAAAARKAFLVTRLGDAGMLLGIFLLWTAGGYHLDFDSLFDHLAKNPPPAGTMTAACLLLFCGAVGKSAQLPLYVWLPDAMEGPTPVSALIHAATMVTAGVYLLARCAPVFVMSPTAQIIVSVIGGLTALLAAFIALTQTDLKRVMAYSTVSQLGYMFMALGCSGAITPTIAVTAAIFHLFTHAFFKALLFLASGSVMHAMGNVIDMRKFSGLRRVMPVTHITFLIGAAALAGLPILSGFWSKDQIIDSLFEAMETGPRYASLYGFVFLVSLLTAAMTAFYTFRAYFLTFWGPTVVPPEAGHHAHESPRVMRIPLIVLAVGALAVGFAVEPLNHAFSHFLSRTHELQIADTLFVKQTNMKLATHPHFNWTVAVLSTFAAVGGVALAALLFRKGTEPAVPKDLQPLYSLSQNKAYVDEIYYGTVVKPAELLATGGRQFDGFLDSMVRLLAFAPRVLGAALRPLQNGLVQFYALGSVLGLIVFVSFVVFRAGR
ncbi:NADH-quinone oxidoreductase subunit L [soil metagenome]